MTVSRQIIRERAPRVARFVWLNPTKTDIYAGVYSNKPFAFDLPTALNPWWSGRLFKAGIRREKHFTKIWKWLPTPPAAAEAARFVHPELLAARLFEPCRIG